MTIFSITNGRSTHSHSLKALQESIGVDCSVVVLRDMKWTEALNCCVEMCKTPLFLRVDDDMIVHPYSVAYMLERSKQEKTFGLVYFHLWEDCSRRIRQSIKVYSRDALQAIGGFQADPKTGKVDEKTNGLLKSAGYRIVEDSSVTALHVCGSWEEQEHYEHLWNAASENPYHKNNRKAVKAYCGTKTLDEQCKMRKGFLEDLNQKRGTPFAKWLKHRMDL